MSGKYVQKIWSGTKEELLFTKTPLNHVVNFSLQDPLFIKGLITLLKHFSICLTAVRVWIWWPQVMQYISISASSSCSSSSSLITVNSLTYSKIASSSYNQHTLSILCNIWKHNRYEYIAPELFLLLITSLFTFYQCLLSTLLALVGTLHLPYLTFISSHLSLPYILPYLTSYLTFRYLTLYLTLHFALPYLMPFITLPYLTFYLTLPYHISFCLTLPYLVPYLTFCLTLPYLTSYLTIHFALPYLTLPQVCIS